MDYPDALYSKNRSALSKEEILENHYMFQRHKPNFDWIEEEGLPDFSKIKIDPDNPHENQSYNWDRFSEPHWVRFNSKKEYQAEYAVVGYLTESIRNLNQYNPKTPNNILDVEHKPNEINYSHCQLACNNTPEIKATRSVRREMRMALKHKAKIFLKPYQMPF